MDNSYPRKLVPRTSHNHDIFCWVRVDLDTSFLGYELSCVWVVRIPLKTDHLTFHKGHPHDAPRSVPILKEVVVSTTYNFPGFVVVMLLLSFLWCRYALSVISWWYSFPCFVEDIVQYQFLCHANHVNIWQMNIFFKHAGILRRSYGSTPDLNNAFLHQSKSSFYVNKPFDISLVLTKPFFGHVIYVLWAHAIHRNSLCSRSRVINGSGPVSLRLMTSQLNDIVTHTQKLNTVKCMFCGVWVQNFVWNFKGALWNFTQNFGPIHCKICILRGVKILTTYDILELWHLKS